MPPHSSKMERKHYIHRSDRWRERYWTIRLPIMKGPSTAHTYVSSYIHNGNSSLSQGECEIWIGDADMWVPQNESTYEDVIERKYRLKLTNPLGGPRGRGGPLPLPYPWPLVRENWWRKNNTKSRETWSYRVQSWNVTILMLAKCKLPVDWYIGNKSCYTGQAGHWIAWGLPVLGAGNPWIHFHPKPLEQFLHHLTCWNAG